MGRQAGSPRVHCNHRQTKHAHRRRPSCRAGCCFLTRIRRGATDLRWPLVPSFLLWSKNIGHQDRGQSLLRWISARGGRLREGFTTEGLAGGTKRQQVYRMGGRDSIAKRRKSRVCATMSASERPELCRRRRRLRGQLAPEVRRPARAASLDAAGPAIDRLSVDVDELRFTARHILGHFPHVIMHDHVEHVE